MFERSGPLLKGLCLLLGGLLAAQVALTFARRPAFESMGVSVSEAKAPASPTNASAAPKAPSSPTNAPAPNPGAPGRMTLPPEVQARIDRITQSEILGQVMRPMPMALLGIAGRDVLFRAPNGQTGLVREGQEMGGVKIFRVGTNRILVEHEQQQKELTIFSGLGSATLVSPPSKEKQP